MSNLARDLPTAFTMNKDEGSIEEFFAIMGWDCRCATCEAAVGASSAGLPCWFMDDDFVAKILMEALAGLSKDPSLKELRNEKDITDLVPLAKSSPDRFLSVASRSWTADTWMLIELSQGLALAVWKMADDKYSTEKLNEDGFTQQVFFKVMLMSYQLALIALLSTSKKMELRHLPNFNAKINSRLANIFMAGSNTFPWIECYFFNFRNVFKMLWRKPTDSSIIREKFVYPTISRFSSRAEIKMSVLSRVPKNLSCDACGIKVAKSSARLYSVETEMCGDSDLYPREVLRLDRPSTTWNTPPTVSTSKRSIAVACGVKCVLEIARSRYPALNAFMEKFNNSKISSLVKYNECPQMTLDVWILPKYKEEFEHFEALGKATLPEFIRNYMNSQLPFFPVYHNGEALSPCMLFEHQGECQSKQHPTPNWKGATKNESNADSSEKASTLKECTLLNSVVNQGGKANSKRLAAKLQDTTTTSETSSDLGKKASTLEETTPLGAEANLSVVTKDRKTNSKRLANKLQDTAQNKSSNDLGKKAPTLKESSLPNTKASSSLVNKDGKTNYKRLASRSSAITKSSKAEVFAKMELLHQRVSTAIAVKKSSVDVDSIVAEARMAAKQDAAASGPSLKSCTFCRREALEMLVCGGCRVTHYCSKKCQRVDCRRHKIECKENHKSMMADLVKMLR